jgi:hypothetical protein
MSCRINKILTSESGAQIIRINATDVNPQNYGERLFSSRV